MTLRDVVHPNERLPAERMTMLTVCCGNFVDLLFKLIQFYKWCIVITRLSISMPRTTESQKQSPADPLRSGQQWEGGDTHRKVNLRSFLRPDLLAIPQGHKVRYLTQNEHLNKSQPFVIGQYANLQTRSLARLRPDLSSDSDHPS